jgi:hypothetical protein
MDQKVFLRLREFAIEFPDGMIVGFGHLQPIKKGWVVKINGQTDFEGETGRSQDGQMVKLKCGMLWKFSKMKMKQRKRVKRMRICLSIRSRPEA